MPWCVRKCPYCDFNSHAVPDGKLSLELEQEYLQALVEDFKTQLHFAQGRKLHSIFIGGGTPSLISASTVILLLSIPKTVPLYTLLNILLLSLSLRGCRSIIHDDYNKKAWFWQ